MAPQAPRGPLPDGGESGNDHDSDGERAQRRYNRANYAAEVAPSPSPDRESRITLTTGTARKMVVRGFYSGDEGRAAHRLHISASVPIQITTPNGSIITVTPPPPPPPAAEGRLDHSSK